jgi:demethylmenaquinone methyltransferase/2-methoxy-6-polyprenyl-1,4-benzoquinol methylase
MPVTPFVERSTLKTKELGESKLLNLLFKPAGLLMGSRLRRWLMDPCETLGLAGLEPGQTVLEVGCGTGFFTIPAARMVGEAGRVIALDASAGFLEEVELKVREARLGNIIIMHRDALDTGVAAGSMHMALLFGVIPFPLLPLDRLLPEMHRLLKPGGTMSVWLFPPLVHTWFPPVIARSDWFEPTGRQGNVHNYRRT